MIRPDSRNANKSPILSEIISRNPLVVPPSPEWGQASKVAKCVHSYNAGKGDESCMYPNSHHLGILN